MGSKFWAFQLQEGARPDIVTMGKPMGNGFPIGAVAMTRAIAQAFDNGMEYFNSFGATPLAAVVGRAVLRVVQSERLQDNARQVGQFLLTKLRDLQSRHGVVGHVRGAGLFVGIELVTDRRTKAPDATTAAAAVNRLCRDFNVLASTDGPRHNVIKLKPPMVFSMGNARTLVAALDAVLTQLRCVDARSSDITPRSKL